jgi:hypothetical protein
MERGHAYNYNEDSAVSANRIGAGHAEGLFEAWANIYHRFARAMDNAEKEKGKNKENDWYPDIDAGIVGVRLIERCIESAEKGSIWVDF